MKKEITFTKRGLGDSWITNKNYNKKKKKKNIELKENEELKIYFDKSPTIRPKITEY